VRLFADEDFDHRVVTCTRNADVDALTERIHSVLVGREAMAGELICIATLDDIRRPSLLAVHPSPDAVHRRFDAAQTPS